MRLMTSDAYPAYESAILHAYGEEVTPPRTGRPGRPRAAYKVPPAGLAYATVEKVREKGRVVEILTRVVFGTMAAVAAALKGSRVSRSINTSLIERQHLTDRHHNARKSRRTYRFWKDWHYHEAATYFTLYSYNFCWPVRTLREPTDDGRLAEADAGDGRRADRSRLVDLRMDQPTSRATELGHDHVWVIWKNRRDSPRSCHDCRVTEFPINSLNGMNKSAKPFEAVHPPTEWLCVEPGA